MDNWGCTFTSATSPESSVEYAGNHDAPDVILMDYQLGPETNGIQLADELLGHWRNIPVCIVSAAPDEDLSTRVTGHGFDFLRKPIKPGKLRALLERYLQKKNS
jgi:CheY-like chemotaxis protein